MSILYKIGASEITFRTLILIFSLIGVLFTYLVGKELFDKKVALIAAFISSSFYVYLFYTARIMTDIPSAALWMVSLWFFWKGYVLKESRKYLWLFGFFLVIATLTRFPAGILLLVILLFLLVTEKLKFLKNKDLWISSAVAIITLLPYSLWYYFRYNKLPILGAAGFYQSVNYFSTYLKLLPNVTLSPIPGISEIFPLLGNYLFLLFLAGFLIIILNLIMGVDFISKDQKLRNFFFIFLWILIPLFYFSFFAGQVPEDRYLIYIYPAIFYLVGFALIKFYNILRDYNSLLGIIVVIFILISISLAQIKYADNIIKIKSSSYVEFKYAGTWIKENSFRDEKVIASGIPQLSYYSERRILPWPEEEKFKEMIQDESIKYIVLSRLEGSPEWSYQWPEKNKDKIAPVQAYLDSQQRPIVIVYEIIR